MFGFWILADFIKDTSGKIILWVKIEISKPGRYQSSMYLILYWAQTTLGYLSIYGSGENSDSHFQVSQFCSEQGAEIFHN